MICQRPGRGLRHCLAGLGRTLLPVRFIFLILLPVATFGADSAQLNLTAAQNNRLFSAVRTQDQAAIAEAIRGGANINARGKHAITPLMLAVDLGALAAVTTLLAHRANPNDKAIDGASAVSLAVENYKRQPDILLAVMQAGGDANLRRPDGEPVIIRFVNDRNCEYMRMMKQFGADVDALDRSRDPILTHAALADDWESVWCLISLGAKFQNLPGFYTLSRLLKSKTISVGSAQFTFKQRVWSHLREHGIDVSPLE